jgi:hypothetical protein
MLQPKKKFKEATLTPSEQKSVNANWEKNMKQKLPKGENAKLESEAYNSWKKTGNLTGAYYNPEPKPEPVKRVEVNKLATKKVQSTMPKAEIVKPKSPSTTSAPMPKKFVPEPKTKKLSSGGRSVVGQNVATTGKNIIGKAKYARQEKMAEAGKKALKGEGAVGPSSTAKLEALREKKSALKEARKETGVKVGKEMRDVRKGIRYEKKVMRGKDVYNR